MTYKINMASGENIYLEVDVALEKVIERIFNPEGNYQNNISIWRDKKYSYVICSKYVESIVQIN